MRQYQQQVISAFERLGLQHVVSKLKECGTFINIIECVKCLTKHFAGFNRCKSRWCLPCQAVRAKSWVARIAEKIFELVSNDDYKLCFLTFTLRNRENLRCMICEMERYWRELVHECKEYRKKFKERFVGGVRSLEVKRGEGSGLWHVHFHCLVVVREYEKDSSWLIPAWKEITKGEGSVDVRGVKVNTGEDIVSVACEVAKYIVKPGKFDVDDLAELYNALVGKRQINTWGLFRGLGKVVERDMDKVEEKKLEQFICSMCGSHEGILRTINYKLLDDEVLWDSDDNFDTENSL